MTVDELLARQKPRRKVQGIAAALLPYEADGRIAVDAFSQQLTSIHRAGLMNAVNMDTGYVNYLSDAEKQEVLNWTREVLGKGIPFVAGAYIEHLRRRRHRLALPTADRHHRSFWWHSDPVPVRSSARQVSGRGR